MIRSYSKIDFKSGYVSLIGRPNTGKSTLLNTIVGSKVSIVTPKPQTTRNRIHGILHRDSVQIVFLDTPGIHESTRRFNKKMVHTALKTLSESDLVLVMVGADNPPFRDEYINRNLRKVNSSVFLVINKIDIVSRPKILELINIYKGHFPYKEIIPICALTGENCSDLVETIINYLPQGPPYYPKEMITDQTERFAAAELIREKLILLTCQEIPYICAVVIDDMYVEARFDTVKIAATIIVEKDSQKGIIIGKGGRKLKQIGQKARREIEILFGKHVYIDIWVKVIKKWRENEQSLKQIGY